LQTFNPKNKPVAFQFTDEVQQVFAVRYAVEPKTSYLKCSGVDIANQCFVMQLQQPDRALENYVAPVFRLL
jgi:hypothetical protein